MLQSFHYSAQHHRGFMQYRALIAISVLICSLPAFAHSPREKLDHYFGIYSEAEKFITREVGKNEQVISRDDWEALLKPSEGYELTDEDLAEITSRQAKEEQANAARAKEESAFDLDILRRNPQLLTEFCEELPKGGMLHVHLSGTTNRETVGNILRKYNPDLSHGDLTRSRLEGWFDPKELDFLTQVQTPTSYLSLPHLQSRIDQLFILPPGNGHSFDRFIGLFIIRDIYKTPKKQPCPL